MILLTFSPICIGEWRPHENEVEYHYLQMLKRGLFATSM